MRDLVFVSNGNGEDEVACRIFDALQRQHEDPSLMIDAWPMVGKGHAYSSRNIGLVGERNLLPSGGFATLDWRLLWRDLVAGWIGTHARQIQAARALRGRYRLIVAVGDIVPILASVLARTPFMFIGCAKSSYYSRWHAYTGLEKRLLRTHCLVTFPRDQLTVEELRKAKVPTRYVGNPMMDGLKPLNQDLGLSRHSTAIALLAGSRSDAAKNAIDMLEIAAAIVDRYRRDLSFVLAAHDDFDVTQFSQSIASSQSASAWRLAATQAHNAMDPVSLRLAGPQNSEFLVIKHRFADVLHRSALAIGMAGTACEQAIGLGVPLIAVPSSGVQGERYVAMKQVFYGEAAVTLPRNPPQIAEAAYAILTDEARRNRMIAAGKERMGEPGASGEIAGAILEFLGHQTRIRSGQDGDLTDTMPQSGRSLS